MDWYTEPNKKLQAAVADIREQASMLAQDTDKGKYIICKHCGNRTQGCEHCLQTERYKPRYTSLLDWKMTDEQLKRRDEMMDKAFDKAFNEDDSEVNPNEPRQSNGAP